MKLSVSKKVSELKPVLSSTISESEENCVYWVYNDITNKRWANLTVIRTDLIGEEFPKTFGHYHNSDKYETYKLISGEGVLLLQRKVINDGKWIQNTVAEIYLVKLSQGEEINISPEWGHSWSNIGSVPLITFDDWIHGHTPADYEPIRDLRGMAVYIHSHEGHIKLVQNYNYKLLKKPEIITLSEFKKKTELSS